MDLADMIYGRSASSHPKRPTAASKPSGGLVPLFGEKEGRIAWANRRKDPLLLFAALQRQLGYPVVPRAKPADTSSDLLGQLARRLERLEVRFKLLEEEQRGGIDLTKFYEGRLPFSDKLVDE
jgi:hypothetical protein